MQQKTDKVSTSKAEEKLKPAIESAEKSESAEPEKAEQSIESILSTAILKGVSNVAEFQKKINEAAQAEIDKAAKNQMLMRTITYLLPPGVVRDIVLDTFEPKIEDVTTLKMFIKGRFGVTMGKGTSKKFQDYSSSLEEPDKNYTIQPWTEEALHRAYHNLEKLPEWQVKLVNNITTCNTTNGGGGVAYWWDGCYNVDYTDDPDQKDDLEKQDAADGHVCTDEDYYRRGLCSFDITFTHELGHVVDQGGKFSTLSDFMAISGWKNEGKDATHLATEIIKQIDGDPYPSDMNETEIKVGNDAAVMIVQDQIDACKESAIEPYVTIAAYNLPSMDDVRPLEFLVKRLVRSNAYYTLARSFAVSRKFGYDYPCYNEPTRTVKMKRYVHEGYTGRGFFSYDSNARAFKISDYQYRDPGEEFAELYAAYHVSGGKVGEKHKAWFEKMALHKNSPAETALQRGISLMSGAKKEEGQKDS